MSTARDDGREAAWALLWSDPLTRGAVDMIADRVMDAFAPGYAHELAEKIRHSEKLRDYTDDHMSDCNMAADLIDPEVE